MGKGLFFRSQSHTWWVTTFALGPKNSWLTYAADSSSALVCLAWELGVRRSPLAYVALAGASGYMAWGLSEYAFHRWLYHQPLGLLEDAHRIHHENPLVLIAMPWFLTPTMVFGLWYLGSVMLRLPCFAAGLAGWLAGSVWYGLVHHSHHHWALRNPWLRTLRVSHRIHHHFPEVNFGVTMRLWDSVFGTRYRKRAHVPRVAGGRQPGRT